MFNIPVWTKEIQNFENGIKNKLTNLLIEFPETRHANNNFFTNRSKLKLGGVAHEKTSTLCDEFSKIISTELNDLTKSLCEYSKKNLSLVVEDVWSVTYYEGDYQRMHNHSSTGLSGILFIDSPDDGPNLDILQPWDDWISDNTSILSVKFKSGAMVVFPSFVKHSSEPNKSKQTKRIISWDMKISEK